MLVEVPLAPNIYPANYDGIGSLDQLPSVVLYRILSFIDAPAIYLELRFASRGCRRLSVEHLTSRFRTLLSHPIELADVLRDIQLAARAHPVHKPHWDSPHFITHTSLREYWDEMDLLEPVPPQIPKPDVTVPATTAALLKSAGFDLTRRGAVSIFIQFASRLYVCNWMQTAEPANYTEPGPSKLRSYVSDLLAQFDTNMTPAAMRAFLELGRSFWAPESAHRYRWRHEMPADSLAALLVRFPEFARRGGVRKVLREMRGSDETGQVGLGAGHYWQVVAEVENWGAMDAPALAANFIPVFADRGGVSTEMVARIVEVVAEARAEKNEVHDDSEDESEPGERVELFLACREVVAGIATRVCFPIGTLGGFVRLMPVLVHLAEVGLGYRRHGYDSAGRVAQMFDEFVVPVLQAEGAREELWVCMEAVEEVRKFVRFYAAFVACLVDLWVAQEGMGTGPLGVWEVEELVPYRMITVETIFYICVATKNWGVLVGVFRRTRPEGFRKEDFEPWKELVMDRAPHERAEARKAVAAVKKVLVKAVPVEKEGVEPPVKKRRTRKG